MNLPKLADFSLNSKKVLVRADLDVDLVSESSNTEGFRLKTLLPTLKYLVDSNCEITLIGHRGRPEGKVVESLSLNPVAQKLEEILKSEWGEEKVKAIKMQMMENLRFNDGEGKNNEDYAKHLAENAEFYINEAFAASHRQHASIVTLPKILPHAAGEHFAKEVENLSKVRQGSEKPVVVIVGGIKKDKLDYLDAFTSFADKILVAGRVPDYIHDESKYRSDERYEVAKLMPDKEDVTIRSVERFEEEIAKAKTVVLAGPIGKYEEEGHRMGTKRVFEAVASSSAFKVVGGGDTVEAVSLFKLMDKFDWVSVGGGATLEFLAKGTLPGIEALVA
jgi:phosphoglycerate kinase